MRVIYLPGGDDLPEIRDIKNDLHVLQEHVDGYIETAPMKIMISADIRMIVNEDGRYCDFEPNRVASYYHSGITNQYLSKFDPRVIVGPALIVGVAGDGFTDVTEYQIRWISTMGKPFVEWDPFEGRTGK